MKVQSRELISKRLIGKGSSSIVYETTWKGGSYARKDFLGVPRDIFEEEAKALVDLGAHPNVVQTYCWTVDEESCSLVIELMDDDLLNLLQRRQVLQPKKLNRGASQATSHVIDLQKFIEDRKNVASVATVYCESVSPPRIYPFSMPEALQLIEQIAQGMEFLHEHEVVHGGLRPKNILVKLSGKGGLSSLDQKVALKVKVADFGLCLTKMKSRALVSSQARHLEMVRWRAPELLDLSLLQRCNNSHEISSMDSDSDSDWDWGSDSSNGKTSVLFAKAATKDSDVYSFGLTCWQILTGEDPYSGLGLNDLVSTVLDGSRPGLPPGYGFVELSDLIQLCLGDKHERPSFNVIVKDLKVLQAPPPQRDSFYPGPSREQAKSPLVSEWLRASGDSSNWLPVLEIDEETEDSTSITTRWISFLCTLGFAIGVVLGVLCVSMVWAINTAKFLFTKRLKSLEEITDRDVRSRQIPYQTLEAATVSGVSKNTRHVRLSKEVEATVTETTALSEDAFLKGAFFLTQLEAHPNLPTLIGYSVHKNKFYLVHKAEAVKFVSLHDVMSLSAAADWRHRHELTWAERYNIALGVGQALVHIHHLPVPIIHGNLSSRNVMLAKGTYYPKLFKFYTSCMFPGPASHSNFLTNDTRGWDAPEKEKVRGDRTAFAQDVYSFGVLLLVLVSDRNAFTASNTKMHVHIVDEAWEHFKTGKIRDLEGPQVKADPEVVMRVLRLALHCVQADAHDRPTITEAVDMLTGKSENLKDSALLAVFNLNRLSDTSQQSSSTIFTNSNTSGVSEMVGWSSHLKQN